MGKLRKREKSRSGSERWKNGMLNWQIDELHLSLKFNEAKNVAVVNGLGFVKIT